MSLADMFRAKKIKTENEQLRAQVSSLQKNLSELGYTEYAQTKAAINKLNGDIDSANGILARLREQIEASRQEAENNEKRSATALRKLSRSKEIYKSVEYAIDRFLGYDPPVSACKISPADSNDMEELLPSVVLKLHCMDMRDLRKAYDNGKWRFYKFNGQTKWVEQLPTSETRQELIKYMLNAYRVLLTRARSGMVICVPEGNGNRTPTGFWEDSTRLPEYYDGTYRYLKSLGIEEI